MRQTVTASPGQTLDSIQLPDGSDPDVLAIDNHSGYWYQVAPVGEWVAPFTTGIVVTVSGTTPDLLAMPTGPAGQVSAATGDPVVVTAYDIDEAPAESRGNPTAWLTPGQTGIRSLGSIAPLAASQGGPAVASYRVLPTERAIMILMPSSGTYAPYTGYVQPHGATATSLRYAFTGYPGSWVVAPISPDLYTTPGQLWDVAIESSIATPAGVPPAFAFAVSNLPVTDLAVGRGQQLSVASLPVVIAADQISFPVSIDSRQIPLAVQAMGQDGSQGQHTMANSSPVVIASDQSPSGGAGCGAYGVSTATGGSYLLTIYTGSVTVRLRRLRIAQDGNATTAGPLAFSLVRISGAPTGGSAVTAWLNAPLGGAPVAVPLALPTVTGGFVNHGLQSIVQLVASVAGANQVWEREWRRDAVEPPTVQAGYAMGVRITASGARAGATVAIEAEWDEV